MAADNNSVISKIKIPNGSVYDIKPSANANVNVNGVYYVEVSGTPTAVTGTLDASLTTYYDGLKVIIYNTLSTDIAENATLSLNSLTPKSIKRYSSTGGNIHSHGSALLVYKDNIFYQDDYNSDIAYESDAHSPVAAMDIYASPEYPAIVCVNIKDYGADHYYSPLATNLNLMNGINLLYDFAYSVGFASGVTQVNCEWGFALLIHDVSLGQRVPEEYLLKRGKYTLHPVLTDTTLQGFYNGTVNGNATGTSDFANSVYRYIDKNFSYNAGNYLLDHPELNEPTVYLSGYCIFPYNTPGNAYELDILGGFMLGFAYASNTSPCYVYATAGKLITENGAPAAIEIDFTDDNIYTYVNGPGYADGGGTDVSSYINIIAINGKNLLNRDTLNTEIAPPESLNNPVSGGYKNYQAGEDINPNSIVCLGKDGSIYNINADANILPNGRVPEVNMDWGLAVYKGGHMAEAGEMLNQGTLLQQCTVPMNNIISSSVPETMYVVYDQNASSGILMASDASFMCIKHVDKENTYVYAGILDSSERLMHYDFSNHDFITIGDGEKIIRINGMDVGGSGSNFTYDNTPAGDAQNPIAGTFLAANSFVVLNRDNGKLYSIDDSNAYYINMDWGVAFLTQSVSSGQRPPAGSLLQQGFISASSISGNMVTDYSVDSSACYLHCSPYTGRDVYLSGLPYASDDDMAKKLNTVIFVGYKDASNNISMDFSNHNFYTYSYANANNNCVSYINGRGLKEAISSYPTLSYNESILSADFTLPTSYTKIFSVPVSAGVWKADTQLTLYNVSTSVSRSVDVTCIVCASTADLTAVDPSSAISSARATLCSSTNAYGNMYLQSIANMSDSGYVTVFAVGSVASRAKVLRYSNNVAGSDQERYYASKIITLRLRASYYD